VDTLGPVPTEGAQGSLAGGVDLDHDGLTSEAQPVERHAVWVGQDRLGRHTGVGSGSKSVVGFSAG